MLSPMQKWLLLVSATSTHTTLPPMKSTRYQHIAIYFYFGLLTIDQGERRGQKNYRKIIIEIMKIEALCHNHV